MAPSRRTYTVKQRVAAVISYYTSGQIFKKATASLLRLWPVQWGAKPAAPANLIRRTVEKFERTGSVHDAPRSGRPPALTAAKALAAAELFKAGYEVYRTYRRGAPPITERRYYTSIEDALRREPRLERIRAKANVSARVLLRAMRGADPQLIRRRLDIKGPLSQAQRQERQRKAAEWLEAYKRGGAEWLRRLVFLDEATIYLADAKEHKLSVWCDAYDDNATGVGIFGNLGAFDLVKLRFYVAVSPVCGPLMLYPTTGSTHLRRRYAGVAPPMEDENGDEVFEVRGLHGWWGQPHMAVGVVCCGDGAEPVAQAHRQHQAPLGACGGGGVWGLEVGAQHQEGASRALHHACNRGGHQVRAPAANCVCMVHAHQHTAGCPRRCTHVFIKLRTAGR